MREINIEMHMCNAACTTRKIEIRGREGNRRATQRLDGCAQCADVCNFMITDQRKCCLISG